MMMGECFRGDEGTDIADFRGIDYSLLGILLTYINFYGYSANHPSPSTVR